MGTFEVMRAVETGLQNGLSNVQRVHSRAPSIEVPERSDKISLRSLEPRTGLTTDAFGATYSTVSNDLSACQIPNTECVAPRCWNREERGGGVRDAGGDGGCRLC
jgi:hypothetical protein